MIFQDTFTDTDGTDLSAHTPDIDIAGNGWVDETIAMEVQGNEAVAVSNGGQSTVDVEESDVIVEADAIIATTSSNRSVELIFRWSDSDNYWGLLVTPIGASASPFAVTPRKKVAGSFTDFTESPNQICNAGETYALKVVCDGSDIEFFYDDVSILSITDSFNSTATSIGLLSSRAPGSNGQSFDNLTASTL